MKTERIVKIRRVALGRLLASHFAFHHRRLLPAIRFRCAD